MSHCLGQYHIDLRRKPPMYEIFCMVCEPKWYHNQVTHTLPTSTKMCIPHFIHQSGIKPDLIFDATNVRMLGVCDVLCKLVHLG